MLRFSVAIGTFVIGVGQLQSRKLQQIQVPKRDGTRGTKLMVSVYCWIATPLVIRERHKRK